MAAEEVARGSRAFYSSLTDLKIPDEVRSRSSFWITVYAAKPFVLIALGLAAGHFANGWLALPLMFLTYLAAQRHFQTLVHDASHHFYSRKAKSNDLLANWLAAGWIGVEVNRYRRVHMKHHAYNGSKDDPEHVSFSTVEGQGGLFRMTLRYVLGLETFRLFAKYFLRSDGSGAKRSRGASDEGASTLSARLRGMLHIFGCQAVLLAVNVAAGVWWGYALWLYLTVTWNPFLSRLRFLAEHPGEDDTTVTTLASVLENTYFAPQSFNYHCEHHGWPTIPPYRLRRMHRFLRDEVRFYDKHGELISGSYIGKLLELAHQHQASKQEVTFECR
jgi:fatty acid desaturase